MSDTTISRRDFLKGSACAAGLFGLPAWARDLDEQPTALTAGSSPLLQPLEWTPPAELANVDPALLVLNRATFGPRPGDAERVRAMGVDNYIEEQMSPARIADTAMDEMLKRFPTLTMSAADLAKIYVEALQKKNQQTPTAATQITPTQIIGELIQATILRQIYSERQLYEVMVDFWSNHFSIYILKNQCKILKTVDDREVIRKNALGKFSDLLSASAHSPAMLVYLDNVTNFKGVAQENYARELMELHTLGVNGGYTQSDVAEVARCLTGWTVNQPRRGLFGMQYGGAGEFAFRAQRHDNGEKTVLGVKLPAGGGIKDVERVLDLLAHHPSTADFVCTRLVRRFVTDDPPPALVKRAADTFKQSDGDMRAVLSAILHADEFKQSFGKKIKRPLEYVASAARALGAQETSAGANANQLGRNPQPNLRAGQTIALALRLMGQVPFNRPTPDGYPDLAAAWINSNNLLTRWNVALALAANRAPGLKVDLAAAMQGAQVKTPEALVDFWSQRLLNRALPEADRAKLATYLEGSTSPQKTASLAALILASPHFQYR